MPTLDHFAEFQQQNLVTLLCWSDQHGKLIANLADPGLFDGDYRDIALAACGYWQRYHQAPKHHTPDMFARRLEAGDRRSTSLRRALLSITQLSENINAEYVINQLHAFSRRQLLKDAILRAAQVLNNDATPVEDAEAVIAEVLRARREQFDIGTKLDDDLDTFLDYLRHRRGEFITGVEALDRASIVPTRKGIFLFIAGKGKGKSWFLVTVGKNAMKLHKRVLHITLEMDEPEVRQRYYQAWFSVPKYAANRVDVTRITHTRNGEVNGYQEGSVPVEFNFRSRELRAELETRILAWGDRFSDLIIKRFPNRGLTIDVLSGYLDFLEQVEHFLPDIVLLDYARLMKQNSTNAKDYRISVGQNIEALRALAIERNFALVTADQLNRSGNKKGKARSTDIGEDISQIFTADTVVTLSSTEAEHDKRLARIFVDHCRGEKDQFTVFLSQALDIGQFAMSSCIMPPDYYERIDPGRHRNNSAEPVAEDAGDGDVDDEATFVEE